MTLPEEAKKLNPEDSIPQHRNRPSIISLIVFGLFTVSIFAAGMSVSSLIGRNHGPEIWIIPQMPVQPDSSENKSTEPEQQPKHPSPELRPAFTFPKPSVPEPEKPVKPPVTTVSKPKKTTPSPPQAQLLSELLLKHQAEDKDVDGVLADTAGIAIACYSLFCQINGKPGLKYEQVKALLKDPEFVTQLIGEIQIINEPLSPPGKRALSVCPDCSSFIDRTLRPGKTIHQDINRYFCKDAANAAPALINIVRTAGSRRKPRTTDLRLVQHALHLMSDTQSERFARMLLAIPDRSRTGTVGFFITESLRHGIERGGWNCMFEAVPVNLDSLRLSLLNTSKQRRACIAAWGKALERARWQPILRTTPHTPSRHRIKQRQLAFVRRVRLLACVNFWLRKTIAACEGVKTGKSIPEEKFLPAKCVIDPVTLQQQFEKTLLSYLQLPQILLEQQRHGKEVVARISNIKAKCAGDWFTAETVLQKAAILFGSSAHLMKFATKEKKALSPLADDHANSLLRLRHELLGNLRMLEIFQKENPEAALHISPDSTPFVPQLGTIAPEPTEPASSLHLLSRLRNEAKRLRQLLSNSPSDKKIIRRLQIVLRHLSIHERGAFQSLADGLQLYIRNKPYLAASLLEQAAQSSDAAILFRAIMKKNISDTITFCRQQYQPMANCKQCDSVRFVTCSSCRGLGYHWCKKCSGSAQPVEGSSATVLPLPYCTECNGIGGHLCAACAGTGQTMCPHCAPEKKNKKNEISYQDFERLQDIIHIARWRARGVIDLYTSDGIR